MKKNIDLVVCTGFRIHAVKRKHGGKRMNIKEVEKVTGISSQNIRFYEKSGLVHPVRNEENGYREYDTNDIRILKLIKMFRMIDMPIEQIKLILSENHKLPQLLNEQEKMLEQKLENTKYAIRVCEHLKEMCSSVEDIDVDLYLSQMEEESDHYFDNWKSDYKDVVKYEHERVFTFVPEAEVTDRYTFENALYAYAMEKNKHITITKRGMYPEFVMDGVEYKAERNYTVIARIPTAVIRCTRKDASEKDKQYRHGRKKWIRILRICWPAVIGMLLLIFLWGNVLFSKTEGRIALLAIMIVLLAMSVRNYLLYWNLD